MTPASAAPDRAAFELGLYRQVAGASAGNESVLVSPYSVRQAVGLAYLGSREATREAIARAIQAGPAEDFARSEKAARGELLAADASIKLSIANGLFLKKGFPFRPAFVSSARDSFDAEIFEREFGPPALAELNGWVKTKTEGRIPSILNGFEPTDRGVLLNAVYFKGNWTKQFSKKATEPGDFHPAGVAPFKHPFMTQRGGFSYAETPDWQAVRLPYGKSRRLGMILVLPARESSLADWRKGLTGESWRLLRGALAHREGLVKVPKFKFDATASLKEHLSSLGMSVAFDRMRADFRDMAEARTEADRLYISRVAHRAFIEVNEEGTEAAAATAVVMAAQGLEPEDDPPPFRFVADRPFFFAIEDERTGTLLFLGEQRRPKS